MVVDHWMTIGSLSAELLKRDRLICNLTNFRLSLKVSNLARSFLEKQKFRALPTDCYIIDRITYGRQSMTALWPNAANRGDGARAVPFDHKAIFNTFFIIN